MKLQKALLCLICLLISACGTSNPVLPVETGVSRSLAEYRKATISSLEYDLNFDIPAAKEDGIPGINRITFNLPDTARDLQIDFREDAGLIHKVVCNGTTSNYRFESEHIVVPNKELLEGKNEIEIEFTAGNTSLNRNDDFLYTLFVPDRARTAFPCFDQPDLKAAFQLDLSVPSEWKAITNGKLDSISEKGEKTHYGFARTRPLPTYLFSFAAGRFETVTRERNGRRHTMYHRETDQEKLDNNTDEIFRLLFGSLDWLEEYTGVPYPFAKYDFVVIPSFQYGGMEHTGATLYKSSRLFLDKDATKNDLLGRANLIAHETAHMWFGDLVTMKWFDQVWLKEVFANFLADKITNPSFPEMNHKLKFVMAHFPAAYSVDRTSGANPVNQILPNLEDAGTVYGAIIYHKSPIVMDMLENIIGEKALQGGLRNYLENFAYGNATWEDLIAILDQSASANLADWSRVWVNKAGRAHISTQIKETDGRIEELSILQADSQGNPGDWEQDLHLVLGYGEKQESVSVKLDEPQIIAAEAEGMRMPDYIIPNGNGNLYGLFRLDEKTKHFLLEEMNRIDDDLARGIAWINLYENLREGFVAGRDFVLAIENQLKFEKNSLVLEHMLSYLQAAYWLDLSPEERKRIGPGLEEKLWARLNQEQDMGNKSSLFSCLSSVAESSSKLEQLYTAWEEQTPIGGFSLSETKATALSAELAIKMPEKAEEIINTQIDRIKNPDRKKRMRFAAPALSADLQVRMDFFASLKEAENREIEPWVLDALRYLNHPLREKDALVYLPRELELLEEIQVTGDIFFPYNWLSASYSGHASRQAGDITRKFLKERPDYPDNLKLKVLQTADLVLRK